MNLLQIIKMKSNSINLSEKIPLPETVMAKFTKIFIKPFAPEDEEGLQTLLNFDEMAYFQQNDTPKDHEPPRYTLQEIKDIFNHGEIYGIYGIPLGKNEEEMIGCYIFENKDEKPDALYIGGLDIHPDYRDLGLGSWVLQIAEEIAKTTDGIKSLTLTVDPLNGRGLNAYLRFGFRVIGFEKDHFGPRTDRFLMEKILEEPPIANYAIERIVSCGNTEELQRAANDHLWGVKLERLQTHEPQDNYHNRVVFIKHLFYL